MRKTAVKTAVDLVPQRHGGALLRGGKPGNRGGGRPRSLVRDDLLQAGHEGAIATVHDMLAGKLVGRTRVSLFQIASKLTCSGCGKRGQFEGTADMGRLDISVETSATPRDRLRAAELLLRYGLGEAQGIDADAVREALAATLSVLRNRLSPERFSLIADELKPLWTRLKSG